MKYSTDSTVVPWANVKIGNGIIVEKCYYALRGILYRYHQSDSGHRVYTLQVLLGCVDSFQENLFSVEISRFHHYLSRDSRQWTPWQMVESPFIASGETGK